MEQNEFLDIDATQRDSALERMHYEPSEIVDAKTFMKTHRLAQDSSSSLQPMLAQFEEDIKQLEQNPALLDRLQRHLDIIADFFATGKEFQNLFYGFDALIAYIQNLSLSELSPQQQKMFISYLEATRQDMSGWVDSVLVRQDARDIHYMDASLLANIAQIRIMLEDNSDASETIL